MSVTLRYALPDFDDDHPRCALRRMRQPSAWGLGAGISGAPTELRCLHRGEPRRCFRLREDLPRARGGYGQSLVRLGTPVVSYPSIELAPAQEPELTSNSAGSAAFLKTRRGPARIDRGCCPPHTSPLSCSTGGAVESAPLRRSKESADDGEFRRSEPVLGKQPRDRAGRRPTTTITRAAAVSPLHRAGEIP
jgi:hypothetical protein